MEKISDIFFKRTHRGRRVLLFGICNLGRIKVYFHWELEYASRECIRIAGGGFAL